LKSFLHITLSFGLKFIDSKSRRPASKRLTNQAHPISINPGLLAKDIA